MPFQTLFRDRRFFPENNTNGIASFVIVRET